MTNESYRPISHPILLYIHFPLFASLPPSPTHPAIPSPSLSFSSHSFSIISPQQPSRLSCSPLCLLSRQNTLLSASTPHHPLIHQPTSQHVLPSALSPLMQHYPPSIIHQPSAQHPTLSACSPLRLLSRPRKAHSASH